MGAKWVVGWRTATQPPSDEEEEEEGNEKVACRSGGARPNRKKNQGTNWNSWKRPSPWCDGSTRIIMSISSFFSGLDIMIMMRQPTIGGSTTLSLFRWAATTRRADSARKQNRPTGTNHMEGGLLAIHPAHTTQREWSAERKKITEREVVQL